MSNQDESIHEFDVNLICNFFATTKRQGPGSVESTLKALSFIPNLTANSSIADLGCGSGSQTMILAQHTPSKIVSLDLFPTFIDMLNKEADKQHVSDRVKGIVGSMDDLPFEEEQFDLIWSEGAIYNIGFERGLNEWRKYLKTNGYIAVTESAWFSDKRPAEIEKFWMDAYPEMDTIPNQISKLQKAGYSLVAAFPLDEKCWTEEYYRPRDIVLEAFVEKYSENPTAKKFAELQHYESDLYDKYKEYYGYVFYIAQKR